MTAVVILMGASVIPKLQIIKSWHFVLIAMISSEILTALLSVSISYALWGSVSGRLLFIGFVDSLMVSFIVVSISIYLLKKVARLEELSQMLQAQIDSRIKAEETLRMSERRFLQMAENINEVFLVTSADYGQVLYISPSYERIWGRSCDSLYRNPGDWFDSIYPEDREIVQTVIDKTKSEKANFSVEYRIVGADRSVRWIYWRGFVVSDKSEGYRVTGIAEDTTERRSLEDQLRQSQKLEAVGILAGGIAHEFSNILTTIKGAMYLIRRKLLDGNQTARYAEQVANAIDKANSLSQSLLTFSRKQTIVLCPVNLNDVIRKANAHLLQFVDERIELVTELTAEPAVVMADMNQIEQVLINLTTNARDAMPEGGVLTIRTDIATINDASLSDNSCRAFGLYVCMSVRDTGSGIDKSIREKIFEPFFTTKASGSGSGLGLAVTYGIVKQHNGFIDVQSDSSNGTMIRVYLPKAEGKVRQHLDEGMPRDYAGIETILLAEDDRDTRSTIREMLEISGYVVLEARDGEEAIEIFTRRKDKIDMLLLDVRMPRKNGMEVYQEVMKIRAESKVLFMSGYTDDIINSHGINEKGYSFISKAASPDEILGKIREVLDANVNEASTIIHRSLRNDQ
ncbi:MAG TPA: ATP-binding protein [Dissulfurispiraceae bacterium]|nr:ATP-binding protein [Dissulfurispiraceae bacterium]